MSDKIHIYKDNKCQWRWRVVANNGKILSVSSEGYTRRGSLMKAMRKTKLILNRLL
jgi:uncharacterized protein YegP (UPF0339 family)